MKPSYATLREAYPLIYPAGQLGFGIECGIGWYDLISQLSADIQQHVDQTGVPQVVATQVKEKFAGLRFYHLGGDEAIDDMISAAREQSLTICEICGEPGTLHGNPPKRWYRTRCDRHVTVW